MERERVPTNGVEVLEQHAAPGNAVSAAEADIFWGHIKKEWVKLILQYI